MMKLGLAPIVLQPTRRARGLPNVGQRIEVSVCNELELWQGAQRVQYRVGEVFVGTVMAVVDNELLDLLTDSGEQVRIYAREAAFEIETLA
jgi:hypothetical protein